MLVATPPEAPGEIWQFIELEIAARENGRLASYLLSFGQDAELELCPLTSDTTGPTGDTGKVFKIVPASQETEVFLPVVARHQANG